MQNYNHINLGFSCLRQVPLHAQRESGKEMRRMLGASEHYLKSGQGTLGYVRYEQALVKKWSGDVATATDLLEETLDLFMQAPFNPRGASLVYREMSLIASSQPQIGVHEREAAFEQALLATILFPYGEQLDTALGWAALQLRRSAGEAAFGKHWQEQVAKLCEPASAPAVVVRHHQRYYGLEQGPEQVARALETATRIVRAAITSGRTTDPTPVPKDAIDRLITLVNRFLTPVRRCA